MTAIRLGASSWTAPSWEGPFYPKGLPAARWLEHYAGEFDTVEVDATFYRIPEERTVDAWRERTPPGFLFAAKVPQVITHEKFLEGCLEETTAFLKVMRRLGDRLGPLLLQFRYFRQAEMPDPKPFLERLERFLPALSSEMRFAVEVRNKSFLGDRLFDLLRRQGIALAFIDHPWFPTIDQMMKRPAARTAPFSYIRWLGDRVEIEKRTTSWDKLILDRTAEMRRWAGAVRNLAAGERPVHGYFNNHYAGYGIGSIRLFRGILAETAGPGPAPAI
ncbi:MAG TPA: DUF72 domain-containing protein [Candidatus Polarisedimenticolia bacterium]|nr:DUF72 domain-containing protein [Candidatus Polarisedimenticolia bacterium]